MSENKHTVLVIEDESAIRRALCERLKRRNFNILEAADGKKGLQKAVQNHPDIILVDISMPIMDGIEFLSQLRDDLWGKTAKVFVLTNMDEKNIVQTVNQYNVSAYCVKANSRLDDLLSAMQSVLP
jgi:CheY-like chemotaxis protein